MKALRAELWALARSHSHATVRGYAQSLVNNIDEIRKRGEDEALRFIMIRNKAGLAKAMGEFQ